MNNKDNYKKAMDQIHPSDELKAKTIQNIKHRKETKITYLHLLSACAVFFIVLTAGSMYYQNVGLRSGGPVIIPDDQNNKAPVSHPSQTIATNADLPRFESFEELKSVLQESNSFDGYMNIKGDAMIETAVADAMAPAAGLESAREEKESVTEDLNYSKTNVQVENVDEADIVKTDGKYIYYITNSVAYIISADNLEVVSKYELNNEKESFNISELYINGNKLVLIGSYNSFDTYNNNSKERYVSRIYNRGMTEALVLDVTDKSNPKEVRTVKIDGNYRNSRMIGGNVYLISAKNAYYYDGCKEIDVLPVVNDSITGEKMIEATDIAYFRDTDCYSFMTVAGFDVNGKEEVCTETFFGASDTVYASQQNLYITQVRYGMNWQESSNVIYKFRLEGSKISLLSKAEVEGNLNNQFSMDEYNGNLRIATTSGYDEKATNQLFILDENLKEIGRIDNLAKGERIYSVRFIGKIGYIVTFEQIDPLFVIDLSDPRNPVVKGELKIPGYSSYLHPYDETHIIGIGYNTKSNGYGGVTNANMKMSMFDVSDLSNPKEMFHVDIGDSYAYSDITYNHKALFEHKEKDLIGFPVTLREYNASRDKDAFVIYHVDLEKGFERYGEIKHDIDWKTNIHRAIYIGDTLYTLANYEVRSYDLTSLEHIKTLEFEFNEPRNVVYNLYDDIDVVTVE